MKKWQKRFMAIVAALGFTEKVKDGSLTADEQKQIFAEYEKQHNITFADDRAANEDAEPEDQLLSAEDLADIANLLGVAPETLPANQQTVVKGLVNKTKEQQQTIQTLSEEPEVDNPVKQVNATMDAAKARMIMIGAAPHTPKFLFGVEHERYSREKWYNELFITRTPFGDKLSEENKKDFMSAVKDMGVALKERSEQLNSNNMLALLDFNKMIAGQSHIDYSDLTGTAGEYVVRRTDLILAYFRSLPSVAHIFPVVSHVQNKEIAPNATFGELSQGYRSGRIFKGNVKFAAEVYSVVDVMFKYKFSDLIKLEKMYIGYLNREGSNVIKWTFVEWIMVHFGRILIDEQNKRRVSGYRVPQQNVVANPANLAADGALRAIERVEEQLKVLPFDDLALYTSISIVDYFESFWDKVNMILPSMDGYKLYANGRHKQWYLRAYRSKYGAQNDFTGSNTQLIDLAPDSIIWVPNMPVNCYKAWITIPGNVENYEDKPNEMTAFYFERDFEDILTLSRWKEGSGLLQAGVQYKTKAELVASNREMQWIFTNLPASALTLAASISFKDNILYKISGDTAVTSVTNYSPDVVYKLFASAAAVEIAKSGPFSKITEKFTAGAAGDYIKVYAELEDYTATVDGETVTLTRPTGKFLELERKVTT
mgnify:CR=1 FL=1